MLNLDDTTAIKRLDTNNCLASISHLSDQCQQAWQESTAIDFPKSYQDINNIIICGMGGSNYGVRIVKSLYDGASFSKISIELVSNYWLPGYTSEKSLVILSSYSGSTEETLALANQARQKNAKIIGITSGGSLYKFLTTNNYPAYIFNPKYNPSKQPRTGVGYMVMGLIGILSKLKRIPVGEEETKKIIIFLKKQNTLFDNSSLLHTNLAKKLALKLEDKIPILIAADFLEGAAYAVRNFFHETSKQFGLHFTVPELNHHLMEGLQFPKLLKKHSLFLFIESSIYDQRNFKRLQLTKEVVKKSNFQTESISLSGYSALTQTMELIQLGSFISFYLAMLHGVDPGRIPWVDYFKKKLKEG